jgi:hypothetical protein
LAKLCKWQSTGVSYTELHSRAVYICRQLCYTLFKDIAFRKPAVLQLLVCAHGLGSCYKGGAVVHANYLGEGAQNSMML